MMAMDLIMEDEAYDNLVYFGVAGKNYIIKNNKIVVALFALNFER
jgi:putative aldouronate transport system substrate-binding protein